MLPSDTATAPANFDGIRLPVSRVPPRIESNDTAISPNARWYNDIKRIMREDQAEIERSGDLVQIVKVAPRSGEHSVVITFCVVLFVAAIGATNMVLNFMDGDAFLLLLAAALAVFGGSIGRYRGSRPR